MTHGQVLQPLSGLVCGMLGLAFVFCQPVAHAASRTAGQDHVAYDTAAACDAAVREGSAHFYRPAGNSQPVLKAGELRYSSLRLSALGPATLAQTDLPYAGADYSLGACDQLPTTGVAPQLAGKWLAFGPELPVHLYHDADGRIVRVATHGDNRGFASVLPRPVPVLRELPSSALQSEEASLQTYGNRCVATLVQPARFETRSQRVLVRPATRSQQVIAPTYKIVTETILLSPEHERQVVDPAKFETVREKIQLQAAHTRQVPVQARFKTRDEEIEVQAPSLEYEVEPAVYRTVMERVVDRPAQVIERVVPPVFEEVQEEVVLRSATTRTEIDPPEFQQQTERVMVRPEIRRYVPVRLPTKMVAAGQREVVPQITRLVEVPAVLETVTEAVKIREASVRKEPVPAAYELVEEKIRVSEPHLEWRRGRQWQAQAVRVLPAAEVRPDATGKFQGHVVQPGQALEREEIMCLIEVPARYETVTRRVLKSAADINEIPEPAQYRNITRQQIVQEATLRQETVPAQYQTLWKQEIDVEKARAQGYRFNEQQEPVAAPTGEPLMRVADVPYTRADVQLDRSLAPDSWVREVVIPAQYQNVTHYVPVKASQIRVLDVPEVRRQATRRVQVQAATTQKVEIPATYKVVPRQELVSPQVVNEVQQAARMQRVTHYELDEPAAQVEVQVPAQYGHVERQRLVQEARVRQETVPAQYGEISQQVLDQAAGVEWIEQEAEYETLTWQVKVRDAQEEQFDVLCRLNAAPGQMKQVQKALRQAGFAAEADGGDFDDSMRSAVHDFQQAQGLQAHGYLDQTTVRSLGLEWP